MKWKQYVHDILTFRAHDWWGLFIALIILLFLLYSNYGKNTITFWLIFIVFVLVFGVFIDINAHEFYH